MACNCGSKKVFGKRPKAMMQAAPDLEQDDPEQALDENGKLVNPRTVVRHKNGYTLLIKTTEPA